MTTTSQQVKAARELLGWSQAELATKAGMTLIAIQVLESKDWFTALNTTKIQAALEAAGIEFVEGEPGVKLRKAKP
jgi:transcriptional regulator with XRE-family HTH domain